MTAIDRAVAVLETFRDGRHMSQAEIARAAGLSEATVFRYLTTLTHHGLVERDSISGRYSLGLRLFQLGEHALGADSRQAALPYMRDLCSDYGETVNLAVRNSDNLVLIEGLESSRSVRRGANIGDIDPWHASGLGKAIMAVLPEPEARELSGGSRFPKLTPHTHTDWASLRLDLLQTRARGYSIDDEEGELGLRCVGAAIFDRNGRPRYALSVSGPANRVDQEAIDRIGPAVAAAAVEISVRLGYTPQAPEPSEEAS
jgi:DNA-binding IclR family transcriptional regulator